MNDIIFRAIKRAQVPAIKEPVSLMLGDNKRPDGTTLLPWARGKPLAWDVTVPDTYAESHLANTAATPGAAANQAAQQKTDKYCSLQSTHIFCPVAIETSGTWNAMAVDLVQEIGRRITDSAAVHGSPAGECGHLPKHDGHRVKHRCSR